ncbi:hypothetical protein WJX81_000271 [Elliptochloris bilobata]|uniref:Ribosome-binding factor A n=1 Tax=Elliptochloris bilobata TaxID=381761 RepID=A0AAW1SA19_9CHLO
MAQLAFVAAQRVGTHRTVAAHPRRVARVARQLEREVGTLLSSDPVLQAAVCPERRYGVDDELSAIATVTEVELSKDLAVAKIYISIYSDPTGQDVAWDGLQRLQGYVRRHIASAIRMRSCPEIRFIRDDSMQRGEEVLALLERVKRQDAGLEEPPPIGLPGYVPAAATAAARGYGPGGARDMRPDWRTVVGAFAEDTGEGGGERVTGASAAVGASSSEGEEDEDEEEESEEGDEGEENSDDDDDEDEDVAAFFDDLDPEDLMPDARTAGSMTVFADMFGGADPVSGPMAPTVRDPFMPRRVQKRLVRGSKGAKGRKGGRRR